jgi:hypothetical protein
MPTNLRDLMKELAFEQLVEGTPAMWKLEIGHEEILVGQMSDGEVHVTKTVAGSLPIIVRANRFDPGLEALLRSWQTVNA